MSVTILFSPSLSRLFLFQAGFSFYQVSQGCFRGSGVYFGDRTFVLNSFQIDDWNLFLVGVRCIQEERFSQHEKRYYFVMAEIAFGLLFFLFSLFLVRLF
jgi:hypothetical protein